MTKKAFRQWASTVVGCLLEQFKGRRLIKELTDLVCNVDKRKKK